MSSNPRNERGIALLIAIFILALGSVLVVDLTYSTYLASRLSYQTSRSLQAEYLLKSGLSLARALIAEDTSPEDSFQDTWASFFGKGAAVPPSLLGLPLPNVTLELEITSEDAKLRLKSLNNAVKRTQRQWMEIYQRLFTNLGFDDDNEEDHTGLFKGRVFTPEEMVANLIDYMDKNKDSFNDGAFQGIEGQLSKNIFRNDGTIDRVEELKSIPGFTPARVEKLTPFVTTLVAQEKVNINMAPREVLLALDEDMDQYFDQIDEYRRNQAFVSPNDPELTSILPSNPGSKDEIYDRIFVLINVNSQYFQILAKVQYSTSVHFMRAYVSESRGQSQGLLTTSKAPRIISMELFWSCGWAT